MSVIISGQAWYPELRILFSHIQAAFAIVLLLLTRYRHLSVEHCVVCGRGVRFLSALFARRLVSGRIKLRCRASFAFLARADEIKKRGLLLGFSTKSLPNCRSLWFEKVRH